MVGAAVQVLLPGPVVLERYQLVEVGAAVDHALFVNRDAGRGAFQLGQAFGNVEGVEGSLGTLDGFGVRSGGRTGLQGGGTTGAVELVEGGGGSGLRRGVAFGGYFAVFFVEFVPAQHGLAPA
ncbi:hypothetical protein D9M71_601850 [compost metagenome]